MMTTNLFVVASVKQLRTGGSFRILLPFFRSSWCVGVPVSAIFNSFHNRVEFGTILEGLRNFGGGGEFEHPILPLGTPLLLRFLSLYRVLGKMCMPSFRILLTSHYSKKKFYITACPTFNRYITTRSLLYRVSQMKTLNMLYLVIY